MSTLDIGSYEPYTDVVVVEGVKYSGELFRELGFNMMPGQVFRFDKREDGVITLTRLIGGFSDE